MFRLAWFLVTLCFSLSQPTALESLGRFEVRSIPEASGIVKSRRHPDIYWVHNDSGNPPALFAIDRRGRIVREYRLDVPNVDWEDITTDDSGNLYVADIGNNFGLLAIRTIYRVNEPDPSQPVAKQLHADVAASYLLPRSERFDAEGLFLDASGIVVVTKQRDGREAELYSVKPATGKSDRPDRPRLVGKLAGFVEPVTGASLSADGQRLAVSSYSVSRVYRLGTGGRWSLLAEVHYDDSAFEGITWEGNDLLLVSEGGGLDRISEIAWRKGMVRDAVKAVGDP